MRPRFHLIILLLALGAAALSCSGFAQEEDETSREPRESKGEKGPKGDKDHRPRGGGPKMEFADLSEEEREKVKEALRVVWADAEVRSARKGLSEASKRYRETLHAAMEKADPQVRPILVRMFDRMTEGGYGPGGRRAPQVIVEMDRRFEEQSKSGDFIGTTAFLKQEVFGFAPEKTKARFEEIHAEITKAGALNEELAAVKNATDAETRREAFRSYRHAYFRQIFEREPGVLKGVFGERGPGGQGSGGPGERSSKREPAQE